MLEKSNPVAIVAYTVNDVRAYYTQTQRRVLGRIVVCLMIFFFRFFYGFTAVRDDRNAREKAEVVFVRLLLDRVHITDFPSPNNVDFVPLYG